MKIVTTAINPDTWLWGASDYTLFEKVSFECSLSVVIPFSYQTLDMGIGSCDVHING